MVDKYKLSKNIIKNTIALILSLIITIFFILAWLAFYPPSIKNSKYFLGSISRKLYYEFNYPLEIKIFIVVIGNLWFYFAPLVIIFIPKYTFLFIIKKLKPKNNP